MAAPSLRTYVYVDGFNLYYGALRKTAYKWLDIRALCQHVLQPHHEIICIRYFTARVKSSPRDPQQHVRQQTYLRALETLPCVSIHFGHFLAHEVSMPLANPIPGQPPTARVIKVEEKGSDVNLASYLLLDGFRQRYDAAVVVSNDSDLKTPIELVRGELQLPAGILNPHARPSIELKKAAKFHLQIREAQLAVSQFPVRLQDAKGRVITKPREWL